MLVALHFKILWPEDGRTAWHFAIAGHPGRAPFSVRSAIEQKGFGETNIETNGLLLFIHTEVGPSSAKICSAEMGIQYTRYPGYCLFIVVRILYST